MVPAQSPHYVKLLGIDSVADVSLEGCLGKLSFPSLNPRTFPIYNMARLQSILDSKSTHTMSCPPGTLSVHHMMRDVEHTP